MKHRRLPLPLCATALALLLSACTPQATTPESPAANAADYLARINELSDTVLALKEESFITKAEYEARIKSLLAEIGLLEDELARLNATDSGGDLPVGGPVDGTPATSPAETAPPTAPPATMAFHYEIRDGRAVILAYLGDEPRVTVPAAIEGYPVTAIEDSAFRSTSVTEVTIPCSVTTIGWFAFADCQSLQSVTLPASVESIGYGAFDACPNLTLYCPASSYAAQYAASFALRYDLT